MLKVAVVGAGAAGLCAIRHALSFGCDVTAFEQSDKVGGTWVYSEETGRDKHGNELHSSMYRGLHTNLPKELMAFPDFPFPHQEKSFIPARDVGDYLNRYADAFDLRRHIRFEHQVVRVRPLSDADNGWEVISLDLVNRSYETRHFESILVCNGHFSTPSRPRITGAKSFRGRQMHSHDYKVPEKFAGRRVLVVGGGPSGVDISQEIARQAETVLWSNHLTPPKVVPAQNVVQKTDVQRLTEEGAVFVDGSSEEFDDIVFCTGYRYTFPFLSVDCGILNDDRFIRPLYKECLSINQPSLALIGLPFLVCPFQMFDLQIRFSLTFMTGRKALPSREDMQRDSEQTMNEKWRRGVKRSNAHALGRGHQDKYFADLASTADTTPLKPFVCKMYDQNKLNQERDFANYRRYKFTLLDGDNFEMEILP